MDIVERLREKEPSFAMDMGQANALVLCHKAADEIERLREALGTIVATKSVNETNPHADAKMMWVGCIQIADAALKEKE